MGELYDTVHEGGGDNNTEVLGVTWVSQVKDFVH